MSEAREPATARHEPIELLQEYVRQRVNGTLVVDGSPEIRIKIAPGESRLTLMSERRRDEPGPDLLTRANLAYGVSYEGGKGWHCLDVVVDGNLTEIYPVLCAIADRIQLVHESFAFAVEAVLEGLSDVLAGRSGLSREEQVGLFGELVVLLSLARHLSATDAVAAWRGPDREEHDFGLAQLDIEVKTTTSERRRHWVTSLTQLAPTADRPLRLLSLQITSAGLGEGSSLANLVESAVDLPGLPAGHVGAILDRIGWRSWYRDLYRERWCLRGAPAWFAIDERFPALTRPRVASVVPEAERLVEVSYRVDLEGIVEDQPLFPVAIPVPAVERGK